MDWLNWSCGYVCADTAVKNTGNEVGMSWPNYASAVALIKFK